MQGWILNMHSSEPGASRLVERSQAPVLWALGEPVFELWFYDWGSRRWFVMANEADPETQRSGVVYFSPGTEQAHASYHRAVCKASQA